MERYPGKLPVNYDSDNKPDGKILAPGKPAGKGWQTAWSLLFGGLKQEVLILSH